MSIKVRLYLGLALLFFALLLAITTALSLPQTAWQFSITSSQTSAESSAFTEPVLQANRLGEIPRTVVRFYFGDQPIPASYHLALEEPDTVATYQDFNALMALNSQLMMGLNQQQLSMRLSDGHLESLVTRARQLKDLPSIFWLQITCGSLGFLICLLIKSVRPNYQGINAFALTGFSYLLFTFAAAIYSTRNVFIDGQLFHALSLLNHAGAMLFSASLTAFLWNYPRAVSQYTISTLAYAVFVANLLVDGLQLTNGPATGSYLWVFGLFLFGLLGSFIQWWFARKNLLDRGAVRWMLLSIYAGTVFFAGGMMLPILLQMPPLASQGLMFTTFLLMYGGLALGVLRYRLFDLERWWFSIWAWFLGGLAILLMDLVLASFLTLTSTSALTLATALVGWLYFPLRQWAWRRISYRKGLAIEAWLPKVVAKLVNVKTPLQLETAWQQSLQALFQPLTLNQQSTVVESITILSNGLQLRLPKIIQAGSLVINNAGQGQRLFTKNDVKNAQTLLVMYQLMAKALAAKAEGANSERDRIRQDIHDDLGAKLLSILHSTKEPRPAQLAKEALTDLRNLLQSIEIEPIDIEYALAHWQQEARERLPEGIQFIWQEPPEKLWLELPPEYFSHLTRAIRECLTNALRHAKPSQISVEVLVTDKLTIIMTNDGVALAIVSAVKDSRGCKILQQRCESLGGHFQYQQQGVVWQVQISIPLPR
ncbi:MAG TPA: sensor histidine kinase [Marinospirillum sp.]|uniref:sensor histidine kinase n=1 Tax=Marinospirillum sp. TaxID=2183934 RepID=UPI002B490D3F|nr:sensor histidine kinase [Marinospirillum sp.]HKM16146.1 sensor histidine kinase [Marinospirillum sp.]